PPIMFRSDVANCAVPATHVILRLFAYPDVTRMCSAALFWCEFATMESWPPVVLSQLMLLRPPSPTHVLLNMWPCDPAPKCRLSPLLTESIRPALVKNRLVKM